MTIAVFLVVCRNAAATLSSSIYLEDQRMMNASLMVSWLLEETESFDQTSRIDYS
jgi:hypothetical protein